MYVCMCIFILDFCPKERHPKFISGVGAMLGRALNYLMMASAQKAKTEDPSPLLMNDYTN